MTLTEDRCAERAAFLSAAGWSEAAANPLAGDASTRSYERLVLAGRRAVLMNAPPGAESAACPPDADEARRRTLGYNAMARLAGPNLNAFTTIAAALRSAGLSAPDVFAADAKTGFALIEDFGDDLYARAIPLGASETELYATAVDALLQLRAARILPPRASGYEMLFYDRLAMEAEIGLVTEWYWPFRKGAAPSADFVEEHRAIWNRAFALVSAPHMVVLRDFHAENLLWLPERAGAHRVGVIDFQDGLYGAGAYDLVSLLEDARRDVPEALLNAMLDRYAMGAAAQGPFNETEFREDFAILAGQRNAKILGIFARLVRRDGKQKYEGLLPRVEGLFRRDLKRPALREVRAFYARHFPELAA